MKFFRLFTILFVFAISYSCVTYQPHYRKEVQAEDSDYPSHLSKTKSFYLIGDAGHAVKGVANKSMETFKTFLDSVNAKEDFLLFLGDNAKAESLASENAEKYKSANVILDSQLDVAKNFEGQVIFLPGELDWDKKGQSGLKKEEEYLEDKMNKDVFMPRAGCPLQFVDISDDVHLIILDSQWFINNWDQHPTINDDCPEIKTREAMLLEIETELKKNQNKTTVFALHHPLYSNGVHGGNFYFDSHLKPAERKITFPVLGSLSMFFRTTGGLSSQDLLNERYRKLINRLGTIAKKWGRVVFVSGHEHSLQYLEKDYIKQIVSGSAAIGTSTRLGQHGKFAFGGPGFAAFDVFENGSSWVSFYEIDNDKYRLLFQKEVFDQPRKYEIDSLSDNFPHSVTTSVYPGKKEILGFKGKFWGEGYRDLYVKEIKTEVADLDTLYGGLEPMRMGGGHQTNSLRVKDSLNREYNFRKIKKDPLQFIQTVFYKEEPVTELFKGSLVEKLVRGFYTASHPYGFLAIPKLADAAHVWHTNPELYYLPKQPEMGKFNFQHGNDLYMIEERPEEHWLGYANFGSPNHDIQSTEGMLDRLRRDEKYNLNESAYVRARIFDMLIGDWDRHNDQWRWAEIEDENGDRTFEPIPRDRDQVFSNFDGSLFNALRFLAGNGINFGVYGKDIEDIERFTISASALDRSLLRNSGKDTWQEQAAFLQKALTNEVIEKAFSELPKEINDETTAQIIEKLKGRRDHIVEIAENYYSHLARLAVVTATDKDDYIDIVRMKDGKTWVRISRNKDGKREEIVVDKVYSDTETDEIIVYGLDDDDQFYVSGAYKSDILVRLIGGQDNDLYDIENGENLKIYDYRSSKNTLKQTKNAKVLLTDDYDVNLYEQDRLPPSKSSFAPGFGFNPDDGFIFRLKAGRKVGNLVEYPFNSQHSLSFGYFSRTGGIDLKYKGEFKNFRGKYNFFLRALYSSAGHTRNFFGFGNETFNPDEEKGWDYNRTRLSKIKGEAGLVRRNSYGSTLKFKVSYETVQTEKNSNGFLTEEFARGDHFFGHKFFAGLEGSYRYKSYDNDLNPSKGLQIHLKAGGKLNTENTDRYYGYITPFVEFYNPISRNRKLVLHTSFQGQVNLGRDYEFYQAATIGSLTGLRGYRQDRFSGQQALAASGNLRYSFNTIRTSFLPLQLGAFGGYDLGRVWFRGEESKVWHDSYGGGLWLTLAKAFNTKLSIFSGEKHLMFYFGMGYGF